MDENNSPAPSPGPASDADMTHISAKAYEVLNNDVADDMTMENSFSDMHSDILMNEASKIFQIGIEKDYIIWEKNKIIEDAMETIETMKKNIYHIQTEYEKLDKNYQKEISNSAELMKRIDTTRNMLESAVHYSNILATSIRQLEDDKFKIAEFYNDIQVRQEEEEEKRKKIEMIVKEQEDFIKTRASQLAAEKKKTEEKLKILTNSLSNLEKKFKSEMDTKAELEAKMEKLKEEMNEMRSNLLLEQSNRMKYQVVQSQLKKKILHEKAEAEKSLKNQKILHKKKLKLLKAKVKNLKERIDTSNESISNYLKMIKDLDVKIIDMNENLEKVRASHEDEVKELEEKLKNFRIEKNNLDDLVRTMEQEKIEGNMKINALTEEKTHLLHTQETIKLNLQEKQIEADKLLITNANLENQLQELSLEINSKIQKINDLEVAIQSYNIQELTEKIRIYEEKMAEYDTIEKGLRNEIALLKETISKECCKNEKVILENHTRIQQLEKEVLVLQTEKDAAEKTLKENCMEYNDLKRELALKTADLQDITKKFESKMKTVSDEAVLFEEYKTKLEKEEQRNKELLQQVQKMADEKAGLDRELMKALEREKCLNQNLEKERKDAEKQMKNLNRDMEKLLKSQEDKLSRAENEILEMGKLSEKLKASEITIMSLKKSLESSEANVEAYKIVIQKLEGEAGKRKNIENETIKRLQSEINQLKQAKQVKEDFNMLFETPHKGNGRGVNQDENENIASASKRTPTTTKRLLSTPNRLLGTSYPSPNFKSISPILKGRDPYDYDSDESRGQLNAGKALSGLHVASKKSIFTTKRKK